MKKQAVETASARIWVTQDGICRIEHFRDADITLEEAKTLIAAQTGLLGNRKVPVLIDANAVNSVEPEARKFFSGEEAARVAAACAFLVGSSVSKIIGNFFIRLNKPPYPSRLFTSEAKALDWLKTFLKKGDKYDG